MRARGRNKDFKVVSIIISTVDNSYYIPINHTFYSKNFREKRVRKLFGDIFTDKSIQLIAHNINFDFHVLERIGITPQRENYFDTLIAARMINREYKNGLEHILEKYLDVQGLHKYDDVVATVPKEIKLRAGLKSNNKATFDLVEIHKAAVYGIEDTENLIDLKKFLIKQLKKDELYDIYTDLIVPAFTNVFFNMEKKGVNIDFEELDQIEEEITEDVNETIKAMTNLIGFEINPDSPKQISELLYNDYTSDSPCEICKEEDCFKEDCEEFHIWKKYGHKNPNIELRENSFEFPVPERTDSGQPSSGKSSLKRFIHYEPKNEWQETGLEFIDLLLHYKKISKLKSSFVTGLREEVYDDGRVHPTFNVLAAKSGRATSSNPNCYDEKTEILTDEGWKYFKDLNKSEKAAQWHEDGSIDFVKPIAYTNEKYKGEMKRFKSSKVELLVTPNHRMYSLTRAGNLKVEKISEMKNPEGRVFGRKNIRGGNLRGSKKLSEKEKRNLEIAIIIQAEGYVQRKKNSCRIRIASKRKQEQLRKIFKNKINKEPNGRQGVSMHLNHPAFEWLKVGEDCKNKSFKLDKLLELDYESREFFLKAIHRWDGDFTRENIYNQHKRNTETVEQVQIMALLTNKSTSWYIKQKDYRAVNINPLPHRWFSRTEITSEQYDGRVYCVTVPSGAIVVRRNGDPVVSGNSQQLPSQDEDDKYKIRKLFTADEGKEMLAFDYANLEVRILAHFSEDEHLLEVFEQGLDSHGATAVKILDLDCHPNEAKKKYPVERNMGKILNFSLLYGMSKHTLYYTLMDFGVNLEDKELQKQYGVYSGQDLANKLYDSYFDSYTGVEKFMENQRRKVREKEYAVTLAGRKIWIPEINSSSRKYRSYGERLASNSIIQGSASDIIMASQVRLENSTELKNLGVEQLLQVHDKLLCCV